MTRFGVKKFEHLQQFNYGFYKTKIFLVDFFFLLLGKPYLVDLPLPFNAVWFNKRETNAEVMKVLKTYIGRRKEQTRHRKFILLQNIGTLIYRNIEFFKN